MLSFLPAPLLFILSSILIVLNTGLWGGLISIGGLFKICLPWKASRLLITNLMNRLLWCWATGNGLIFQLVSNVSWDIKGLDSLQQNAWYLVISNHLSALDIAVQSYVLRNHIPMLKFFLKKELLYVPIMGLACWALDMPFMHRTSVGKLKKNPRLKGKDFKTTKKACKKFRFIPTTIMNYVEGSRFTEEKRLRQNSPYRYLLRPKAGGIAFALATMGQQFTNVLNMTVLYPDAPKGILAAAMRGKVRRVVVRVEALPVPEVVDQAYLNDPNYRSEFQRWLNQLWENKDQQIGRLLSQFSATTDTYAFFADDKMKHNYSNLS